MRYPKDRHIVSLVEEPQYLCKCPECNDTAFPDDMLYWHKDGFYCEHCFDDHIWLSYWQRGRSLGTELKLKAERGRCYRSLPTPLYLCGNWFCEFVWFAEYLWFSPEADQFFCAHHLCTDRAVTYTLADRLARLQAESVR